MGGQAPNTQMHKLVSCTHCRGNGLNQIDVDRMQLMTYAIYLLFFFCFFSFFIFGKPKWFNFFMVSKLIILILNLSGSVSGFYIHQSAAYSSILHP